MVRNYWKTTLIPCSFRVGISGACTIRFSVVAPRALTFFEGNIIELGTGFLANQVRNNGIHAGGIGSTDLQVPGFFPGRLNEVFHVLIG